MGVLNELSTRVGDAATAALQRLDAELTRAIKHSYGHAASVYALAATSVALLLSVVVYFLAPVLEDDFHLYSQYLPWLPYLDWSQYNSFLVDHGVVLLAISLPMGWLLLVNVAYSRVASRLDLALLMLRVVCAVTVCLSLTVILTEFLSRRVTMALLSLGYGALGLAYAWSVPVWRWYLTQADAHGLVALLPTSLQELLLRTSLLEWLTDTSFMDRMRPFLPLLLPLSKAEQDRVLESMPVETQVMLTRPGLAALLPPSVQHVLLPTPVDSRALVAQDAVSIPETAEAGFDFHRQQQQQQREQQQRGQDTGGGGADERRVSQRQGAAVDDIVGDIVSKRVWRGCMELVKMPSPASLDRTVAVSTALFALQLYASRRSRRAVATLLQLALASSLASVAGLALVARAVQMVAASNGSCSPLLRFIGQYLVRAWTARAQIAAAPTREHRSRSLTTTRNNNSSSNSSEHEREETDSDVNAATLSTATKTASAVVAVLFVVRQLRR